MHPSSHARCYRACMICTSIILLCRNEGKQKTEPHMLQSRRDRLHATKYMAVACTTAQHRQAPRREKKRLHGCYMEADSEDGRRRYMRAERVQQYTSCRRETSLISRRRGINKRPTFLQRFLVQKLTHPSFAGAAAAAAQA